MNTAVSKVQETIDAATVAAGASKVTGAGSAMTLFSWATSSDIGVVMGILIGVTGLIVNWYFKRKADRRSQEAHAAYMRKLEGDEAFALHEFRKTESDE